MLGLLGLVCTSKRQYKPSFDVFKWEEDNM